MRTLLQNQDSLEGPKVDPLDLMKAYKVQGGPPGTTKYVYDVIEAHLEAAFAAKFNDKVKQ